MNNTSPFKTGAYYGLLSALCSFAWFLIVFFIGKNSFGPWSWLAAWVPIAFIIIGIKVHRDRDLGGPISFGRCLGVAMIVAVCASLLFAILSFVFTSILGDNLIVAHITEAEEGMEKAKGFLSEEMFDKAMQAIEEMKADHMKALRQIVFGNFVWGMIGEFFVAIIASAVMKKKENPFTNQI